MTSTRKACEGEDVVSRALGFLSPAGSAILLVLLPKCPLCVAAYLTSVGLGIGVAASVAPLLRPLLVVVAALGGLGWLGSLWRARRRRPVATCCCEPNLP